MPRERQLDFRLDQVGPQNSSAVSTALSLALLRRMQGRRPGEG